MPVQIPGDQGVDLDGRHRGVVDDGELVMAAGGTRGF
jgi:hypothetical protein